MLIYHFAMVCFIPISCNLEVLTLIIVVPVALSGKTSCLHDDYERDETFMKYLVSSLDAPVIQLHHVTDALDCAILCRANDECFSFNIATERRGNRYSCDLLPFDVLHVPLTKNVSSTHFSRQDPCHDIRTCPTNTYCAAHYNKKSSPYTCATAGQTCRHIKTTHPTVLSGNFFIAPDGENGQPRFAVYCDMVDRGGIGVTVVTHNSGTRTLVNGYEATGSYSRDILYNKPNMAQLAALTNASSHCEQSLKLECHGSHIQDHFWVSRDGTKMTSWGSSCACPTYSTCSNTCNCKKNDAVWREDSVVLTNKEHLPVWQLRFGDTGGWDEKLYYTLGSLTCY